MDMVPVSGSLLSVWSPLLSPPGGCVLPVSYLLDRSASPVHTVHTAHTAHTRTYHSTVAFVLVVALYWQHRQVLTVGSDRRLSGTIQEMHGGYMPVGAVPQGKEGT